ncbi:MAG: hypothetical protein A2V66_16905 [Ignavibacteria bacterium RBG_13_36_8]|nr:MAG: hypothetical protein A2V66_16905 [Ignavibacteria bacterium RBG_13_36_8]
MFENGAKLRSFLKESGIEITKIASQLGVTRQTIDRWLNNDKNLDKIFDAAARPFLNYLKTVSPQVNEEVVAHQAKKIMELEKENENLKKDCEEKDQEIDLLRVRHAQIDQVAKNKLKEGKK